MKVKLMADMYTLSDEKLNCGELFNIDYVDDKKELVWLKRYEKEMITGDIFVSYKAFRSFFRYED